jgi:hypothetical protein
MKTQPVWFRAKRYGYGWFPNTWQGWLITGTFLLAILAISRFMEVNSLEQNVALIGTAILLIIICYKTGEKPSWNWGNKTTKRKK